MNYNDGDLFDELHLIKRRPLNLLYNLIGRELGTHSNSLYTTSLFNDYSNSNESTNSNQLKRLHLTTTPNYTIFNVKTPHCFFRRFSPDGRHLIAFDQNLNGVHIFLFHGCQMGISDIEHINLSKGQKLAINLPS